VAHLNSLATKSDNSWPVAQTHFGNDGAMKKDWRFSGFVEVGGKRGADKTNR
jgi:hypothetical protein